MTEFNQNAGWEQNPDAIEAAPKDFHILDQYQQVVVSQVIYDDGGRTIQGYPPEVYFHLGIKEEMDEIWFGDPASPYNRFKKLLARTVEIDEPGLDLNNPAEEKLHTKEFGDVSWYLANMLNHYGIPMSVAVQSGIEDLKLERNMHPRCDADFARENEKRMPWVGLASRVGRITRYTEAILCHDGVDERKALARESGRVVLNMSQVTQTEFGVMYQDIMEANIEKVESRTERGVVFSDEGGDDR